MRLNDYLQHLQLDLLFSSHVSWTLVLLLVLRLYNKVFVRDYSFDFSPALISEFFNLPVVESDRARELGLDLDMTIVVNELAGFSVHEWPESNVCL